MLSTYWLSSPSLSSLSSSSAAAVLIFKDASNCHSFHEISWVSSVRYDDVFPCTCRAALTTSSSCPLSSYASFSSRSLWAPPCILCAFFQSQYLQHLLVRGGAGWIEFNVLCQQVCEDVRVRGMICILTLSLGSVCARAGVCRRVCRDLPYACRSAEVQQVVCS